MEVKIEYKVTITRLTTTMKTGRVSFEKIGEKDGETQYDYVPALDKMETDGETVLEILVPKVDFSKIFEAVTEK